MVARASCEFKDSHHLKFPCNRREYCRTVGEAGQQFFQQLLQEVLTPFHSGTTVFSNPVNGNGQDLTQVRIADVISKFEVLNWHVDSIMDMKRAKRIRANLRGVRFKAILGTIPLKEEPWHNISAKARYILRAIPKFYTGFQILPPEFYLYFKEKNPELTFFRELQCTITFELTKKPLEIFLSEIGLIPLITIRKKYDLGSRYCKYTWSHSNTVIDGFCYQLYDGDMFRPRKVMERSL